MELFKIPSQKRRDALPRAAMGYRYTPNTTLVQFSTMVTVPGDGDRRSWRTFRMVAEMPHAEERENYEALERLIANELLEDFAAFGEYDRDGLPQLYVDGSTQQPVVVVNGTQHILSDDDIFGLLAKGSNQDRAEVMRKRTDYFSKKKYYGYLEDMQPRHRSFRYYVRGADVPTLMQLLPDTIPQHAEECNRMCMYQMLRDRNPPRTNSRHYFKEFDPEAVNAWLKENGHNVGALIDGLTPEDVQAHAEAFRYNHAALDITRSIVLLHMPENPRKDLKTIAYTVVGDHAIPFTDPDVIESIMTSAAMRLGKRRGTNYSFYGARGRQSITDQSGNGQRRKRKNSLNRVFQTDTTSKAELREQGWRDDAPIDFEVEDREEEFEDNGSQTSVRTGASGGDGEGRGKRRTKQYPLAQQERDRFVFFTKEHDRELIRTRLRPEFVHGTDPMLVYYYVCTDERNIEFLYDYCIRVLNWDPTTAARSFNGRCTTLQINNVIWAAQPDIHEILHLHRIVHPKEPFRMTGMASYAYRLLYQELTKIGRFRGGTNIWDCMSQYPPNLQRILDNHHPYHRPKLLQKTYHAPYDPPPMGQSEPIETIPWDERRRVDLIRSYTATLLQISDDRDQFPIHDVTNQVVPYDPPTHGHYPIGHYVVNIPSKPQRVERGTYEKWERLPCFPALENGEKRTMSHRMLRALIHRGLLVPEDIDLVCTTDPVRQGQYGPALVQGFLNLIHTIYQHPELQDPNSLIPKMLVNYLVGLCNGTTLPHSGNRFVFRNLEEMYQLMLRVYTEDQLQKVRLTRTVGTDPYWDNVAYLHYEMTTSGLSYRSFHFQPVYNIVLESQAIHMYDLILPIPLHALIQLNIDACEYRVRSHDRHQDWVKQLDSQAVDVATYKSLSPKDLLEQRYLGRYKPEAPKDATKWKTYHYNYQQARHETVVKRLLHESEVADAGAPALEDPENRDWVANWRSTLRIVQPRDGVRDPAYLHQLCVEWFQAGATERSGLLITGPAGTGKTHLLRQIYQYAKGLNLNVVRTAFTHSACVQLGPDAVTLSSLFGLDHLSDHRCIMVMSRRFAAHLRHLNIDVLMIDEISMIPLDILECLLYFRKITTHTRIVLSGDFYQLPPVEPGRNRPDDYNYFNQTDIFPYLLYDRVRNLGGRWVQLTECMRTDDPLLQKICSDPHYVVSPAFHPADFPVAPQQAIWRFLCHTNRTRKACNWYCMIRWLAANPEANCYPFDLRDIYIHEKLHPISANGKVLKSRFDEAHWAREFEDMMARFDYAHHKRWRENKNKVMATNPQGFCDPITRNVWTPKHWEYLQNFVYAEGMEVVSRNTLRDRSWSAARDADKGPLVVNNRRAVIETIDVENRRVTLVWMDVLQRRLQARKACMGTDAASSSEADEAYTDDEEPLILPFYDFAFNFVPGFCITVHMSQGETIREHYGILDWNEIQKKPPMAYVAVTRASHPDFLHIVSNYFTDPWDSRSNHDVALNVLKKMYHMFKTDFEDKMPWYRMPLDLYRHWKQLLVDSHQHNAPLPCESCGTNLKLRGYLDRDLDQFKFLPVPLQPTSPKDDNAAVVMDVDNDKNNDTGHVTDSEDTNNPAPPPPSRSSTPPPRHDAAGFFKLVCDKCQMDILCSDKVFPGDIKKDPKTRKFIKP